VREEESSAELEVDFACVVGYSPDQFFGYWLCAELADEAFVVNLASYFPRCDHHFVFVFVGQISVAYDDWLRIQFIENVLNLMWMSTFQA